MYWVYDLPSVWLIVVLDRDVGIGAWGVGRRYIGVNWDRKLIK